MPSVPVLLTECESICRTVAPRDLANLPLYILPQSALPPELNSMAPYCNGYTINALDLYYRDVIGDAWKGRGPCMVMNAESLTRHIKPDDPLVPAFFHSVALHELAHIIVADYPYQALDEQPVEVVREIAAQHHESWGEHYQAERATCKPSTHHRDSHGSQFIRAGVHLWHRGRQAGHRLLLGMVIGTREYFPLAYDYPKALADELDLLADWKISDILLTEPSQAFQDLWAKDQAAWIEAHAA